MQLTESYLLMNHRFEFGSIYIYIVWWNYTKFNRGELHAQLDNSLNHLYVNSAKLVGKKAAAEFAAN